MKFLGHVKSSESLLKGVYCYGSPAILDSLKIINGAAFRMIGLTKMPKIEFLPLDWIYHSIRIMTVSLPTSLHPTPFLPHCIPERFRQNRDSIPTLHDYLPCFRLTRRKLNDHNSHIAIVTILQVLVCWHAQGIITLKRFLLGNHNFIHHFKIHHYYLVSYLLIMTRSFSQNYRISVYQLWVNWSEVQMGVASIGVPVA